MWILAWQDPETQGFLQLIINWSKSIPNWLLNGKSSYFDPAEPTHKVHWGQVPFSSRACLCSAWAGKTTRALLKAVQQVNHDFFSKPCGPKTTILSCSANSWQQKRTAFTNEVIRWLQRTRNEQNCSKKQRILTDFMQVLKNSGYNQNLRREVLRSAIKQYNTILEQAKSGVKPIYRTNG